MATLLAIRVLRRGEDQSGRAGQFILARPNKTRRVDCGKAASGLERRLREGLPWSDRGNERVRLTDEHAPQDPSQHGLRGSRPLLESLTRDIEQHIEGFHLVVVGGESGNGTDEFRSE